MNNILFIKSSLNGEQGNSTILAQELVANLSVNSEVKVVERDLAEQGLEHLTQIEMAAWMTPANERNSAQVKLTHISDSLIEELTTSDTLVIAMPMYNYGVPSTFKAWVDRVARAGVTFRYTENGPVGLLKNKKVVIVAARGGIHAGTTSDSQTQYLTSFFNFLGLDDITFIYAEGLNMPGNEERYAAAQAEINNFSL
jgi:FMN-dependent NADH-azoreductase|tara:strand:+ start:12131 stop:12724 length:594 start_codon:yes stop_codon:yes gene_type:complete